VPVVYTSSQAAGNLNVVVVGWNDTNAQVQSVTDSRGNAYVRAVGPTTRNNVGSQSIYYSANIASAGAGVNTVTVRFSSSAQYPDIRIAEYRGIATTNPVDVAVGAQGTNASLSDSGVATTTNATDLLVGANLVVQQTVAAGAGYTSRIMTTPDGDILEDEVVTSVGSYNATALLTGGAWIMQMVAFRAAPAPDTQAPSAPTNLAATAPSSAQTSLTWIASSDNVGVTGYRIERCQGAGCGTFVQVGTSTTTGYSDTSVAASTSYSYRVRATDAAGNLSAYSNTASATSPAPPDTQAPTDPTNLAAAPASSTQVTLVWTPSMDDVGVSSYLIERCQGAGCDTFVQIATTSTAGYTDGSVVGNTTYRYRVRARDAALNLSGYSGTATTTTPAAPAVVALVQTAVRDAGPATSASLAFSSSNVAGNWIAVAIRAGQSGQSLVVSDTRGNTYREAVRMDETTDGTTLALFYSENIAGGSNTVTVSDSLPGGTLRFAILEYAGVASAGSFDVAAAGQGTSALAATGAVITSTGGELILGIVSSANGLTFGAGGDYAMQARVPAAPNTKLIVEDQRQMAAGLVSANATLSATDDWGALVATFRPAAAVLDTDAPTAPGGLTATAVSSTQVNLLWTAASDNLAVTSYLIERCQGSPCGAFAQIATTSTVTYTDAAVTPATSYSYRVRAIDAAFNVSGYSSTTTAVTPAASDTQAPTTPANLTAAAISSTQVNLSWAAASDNVAVTNYLIERCQGAGCATFVQMAVTSTLTYSDVPVTASTSYSYRVRATDAATNLSAYSNTASVTTPAAPAAIALVQATSRDAGVATSSSLAFTASNTAGNWIAVAIRAGQSGQTFVVNDTRGNTYRRAVQLNETTDGTTVALFYSENIAGGPNTVTVSDSVAGGTLRFSILEYAGIASGNSLDVTATRQGTSATPSSGAATTTSNGELVVGVLSSANGLTFAAGSGFTVRTPVPDPPNTKLLVEDQRQVAAGPIAVTATLTGSDNWGAALAAFRPSGPPPDTEAPAPPGGLTATAVSGAPVNLGWSPATDNVGVMNYLVERCEGAGCSAFAQIGTTATPGYSDTSVEGTTSYSYRVRAMDAASNLSGYSNVASVTTPALPDTQPPSAPGLVTATAISGTRVDLSWIAATDNVGVSGYRVERCQGSGCTIFVKLATPTGTTLSDTGLTPNTVYRYVVLATDAAGNLGPYTSPVNVSTLATIPELVAAYSFNEGSGTTAHDTSGRTNDGAIGSATWTPEGKYGGSLSFNGTTARVVIPDNPTLRLTTGLTLEAWVKPGVVNSAWRDVIYKGDDNYFLEATTGTSAQPGAGLTLASTGNSVVFGPASLAVDTWTHLAQTYDGATVRLYVNGVQVASAPKSGLVVTSSYPLEIGGDSIYGQPFTGLIDEVRVFNVARTPTQIQSDMSTPLAGGIASAVLSPSTVDFGPEAVGLAANIQNVTLANSGTATLTISGIAMTGTNGGEFSQTNTCGPSLDPGASCAIAVTFTPALVGPRAAQVTVQDDAAGAPHIVSLQGIGVSVLVTPNVATMTPNSTQQFSAASSGVTDFVWSVDGVPGGSIDSGTITAAGLYSAPAAVGNHTIAAMTLDELQSGMATVYVVSYAGTLTSREDNTRTGANLNETVLTPTTVNPARFGKLRSFDIDGEAFASPLYVPAVNVPGAGVHNVIYIATEHDSVYAFDADGLVQTPLWRVSFINPAAGVTTLTPSDVGECCDINPEIGISGTPVIDAARGILYVVAKTKEVVGTTTNYVQRLHALDLATGQERLGGPVVIQASVPGSGAGTAGGQVAFSPLRENQRPGLLLQNGVVYIAFGSHGDQQPYHGWVLGYDAATLQQTVVHNTTPNGEGGGVWIAESGPAADANGNIYFVTGDGTFDANIGGTSFGDSYVKMTPQGSVADYFTPHDQGILDSNNIDLGSGGLLLLPDQPGTHRHLMVSAGKNGTIDLIDRDNMGHYRATNDSQIVQSLINIFPFGTPEPGNYSAPVHFNGTVYFSPVSDNIQAFRLADGLFSTTPTSRSSEIFAYPGGTIALSASGNTNGMLWAIERRENGSGTLRAYDATNLAIELYNSDQSGSRDTLDSPNKFSAPVIANGKVYVASKTKLTIFGLFQ